MRLLETERLNKEKQISLLRILTMLIAIPIDIVIANEVSNIVDEAMTGNVTGVVVKSVILLGVVLVLRVIQSRLTIRYKKESMISKQELKVCVYGSQTAQNGPDGEKLSAGDRKEQLDNDVDTIIKFRLESIPDCLAQMVIALVYVALIGSESPITAGMIVAMSLLQIIPPIVVKKWLEKAYNDCRDIEADISNAYLDCVNGFETIAVFGCREWLEKKMRELDKAYGPIGNRSIMYTELENTLSGLVKNVLKYGVYVIAGLFVMNRILTLEGGITTIVLADGFLASVGGFVSIVSDKTEYKAARKRLKGCDFTYKQGKPEEKDDQNVEKIEVKDLCFGYDGVEILENVTLDIGKKEKIVLKGENGSGKSTLLKLLIGDKTASSGTVDYVLEGGKTVRAGDKTVSPVVLVGQDDLKLPISAEELFKMAAEDKRQRMFKSAYEFGLTDEEIRNRKISSLSGGERKKVFLSFGLGIGSLFLFLDEPVNHLDADAQRMLKKKVKEYPDSLVLIMHNSLLDEETDKVYQINNRRLSRG